MHQNVSMLRLSHVFHQECIAGSACHCLLLCEFPLSSALCMFDATKIHGQHSSVPAPPQNCRQVSSAKVRQYQRDHNSLSMLPAGAAATAPSTSAAAPSAESAQPAVSHPPPQTGDVIMADGDAAAPRAKPKLVARSYTPPDPGPYPENKPPENPVRFTPVQVSQ